MEIQYLCSFNDICISFLLIMSINDVHIIEKTFICYHLGRTLRL